MIAVTHASSHEFELLCMRHLAVSNRHGRKISVGNSFAQGSPALRDHRSQSCDVFTFALDSSSQLDTTKVTRGEGASVKDND